MNVRARRIAFWRIMSSLVLLLGAAFMIVLGIKILQNQSDQKVFGVMGCFIAALFSILQSIFILYGIKKESSLQKIAYDDVGKINWTAMIFVLVGTAFGIGLSVLSIVLFFLKPEEPAHSMSMAIFAVALYLDINCFVYLTYSFIFRKRPIDLKRFIK